MELRELSDEDLVYVAMLAGVSLVVEDWDDELDRSVLREVTREELRDRLDWWYQDTGGLL